MKKPYYYITCEDRKTENWKDFKFTDFNKLVEKIDLNKYEVVLITARNFPDRAKAMAENNINAYMKRLNDKGFFESEVI